MKRLQEILKRKAEIRAALEGGEKVDLDAFEKELRELDEEQKEIETRQRLLKEAGEINDGTAQETRTIQTFSSKSTGEEREEVSTTDSNEYRKAFMDLVLRGKKSDILETRAISGTGLADVGTVIPQTVINRIVEKMKSYGQIYSRITQTNVKGGVSIPTSNLKPVATWTDEGSVSAIQKKTTGEVTFSYHKLQCRVAVTLEADTVSMDIFESALVDNIYEAIIVALEQAIVSGTGVKQPLGITVDPSVTNTISVLAADVAKYTKWTEIISQLPLSAEGKVALVITKTDWDKNILGMVDANGQPIARVTYGLEGKPQRRFLGYEVILVEDYLPTATGAADNEVFAFFADLKDYMLNSNLQYTYKKYFDDNTDEYIHKTTLIADGKLADPQNVLLIKKAPTV
ncbi:capsid protein [Domibacillus antri]|uniref:Capsid protein n=1 Tax=Domibacillus antri TaxID=1714264 RepID=A0A1Q8Q3H7_9BACI|nr:phage major capsid protein [Domibacillus antri]OLN21899.1 capsid protein [Domibacillus antri]